ncbi:MAG: preprotein translocase subunit SecE [Fimbriimonadaceae bacterium]
MSKSQPASAKIPTPKVKAGPRVFFAEIVREMKKVNWPKPNETTRLTGVVVVVILALSALIALLSFGWDFVLNLLIPRA